MELCGGDLARSPCAFRGKWLWMCCWAHKDPYDAQRWDQAPPGAPSILKGQGAWCFIAKPLGKAQSERGTEQTLGQPPRGHQLLGLTH